MRLVIRDEATTDLEGIFELISEDNSRAAVEMVQTSASVWTCSGCLSWFISAGAGAHHGRES